MKRGIAVAAATLVVLSAASTALAVGVVGTADSSPVVAQDDAGRSDEYDEWVAPGTGGAVEKGREDDDEQQYPGKTTFEVDPNEPGIPDATFNIYAEGFSEDNRMHWNIVDQADFTWNTCSSQDASAFGIDRGNDDSGTTTDESLLQAYEDVTYHADGIRVRFYKEETLAGNPVNVTVDDQIVSQVEDCLTTPDREGWYRLTGYINGSTKMDAQTDYTIYGAARYVYICEGCDSREAARDRLGPEPNKCPQKYGQAFVCRTEDGEYYTASDPPGGGDDDQSQSTPTPTPGGGGDGATPTPTEAGSGGGGSGGGGGGGDATPTPVTGGGGGGGGGQADDPQSGGSNGGGAADTGASNRDGDRRGAVRTERSPVTPTIGQGPGFGPVLAFVALLLAALLALRRES